MTYASDPQTLLRQGIAAVKAGQTAQARQLLMQVIEIDETIAAAWLWLSAVMDDPTDKFTCLHNVLNLEPDNRHAQMGLARLEQRLTALQPPLKEPTAAPWPAPAAPPSPPPSSTPTSAPTPPVRTSPSVVEQPAPPPPLSPATPRPTVQENQPVTSKSAHDGRGVSSPYKISPPTAPQPTAQRPDHLKDHASVAAALLKDNFATQKPPPPSPAATPSPTLRPLHVKKHASMASALIQHKAVIPEAPPEIAPEEALIPHPSGPACPFCRQSISVMASRCEACHLPLVVDCPACGARLDVEGPVCTECGYELGNYRHKTVYFAHLATAYQERKQYRQALDTWKMVEKLNPKYPNLYLRLAETQAATGHAPVAITILRQVLATDPGQEEASLVLGQIYGDLGYWDDVKAVYHQALAVTPQSAELHFALGWLLLNHNHLERALPQLQEALKCNPQHGLAWFRLGQLYQMSHQPKLATEAYRQAVALLPPDTLVYQEAIRLVNVVKPELPRVMSTSWWEFVRQMTGPILICVLAALLDSGLRPWWIPLTGWLALLLGFMGSLLWVSGASLPANPMICWLVGERGLFHTQARTTAAAVGAVFWVLAMGLILAPIGQSSPEVPSWILNS